jgi:hypothetical protein
VNIDAIGGFNFRMHVDKWVYMNSIGSDESQFMEITPTDKCSSYNLSVLP